MLVGTFPVMCHSGPTDPPLTTAAAALSAPSMELPPAAHPFRPWPPAPASSQPEMSAATSALVPVVSVSFLVVEYKFE